MKSEETIDRFTYEKNLWSQGFMHVMGLDEVGRGCLAGPVVSAAVILKKGVDLSLLKDSKKITFKKNDKSQIIPELIIFS